MKKSRMLLFIGVIILIFITPLVFTRPTFWEYFDFSNTGQIGDTIGGITAPFINLLGAILVYLSFSEQLNANRIQEKALLEEIKRVNNEKRFNSIIHDIDNLRKDINDYKLIGHERNETGSNAIFEFREIVKNYTNQESFDRVIIKQMADNIGFLMSSTNYILRRIDESGFSQEEIKNLKNKVMSLYSPKVGIYVSDIINAFTAYSVITPTINVMALLNPKFESELIELANLSNLTQ